MYSTSSVQVQTSSSEQAKKKKFGELLAITANSIFGNSGKIFACWKKELQIPIQYFGKICIC
jgi:hypothetical protein